MTSLRVVCTPIGNVGDMSPRATEALRTAALVLAEDTRKSQPLLERLSVKTRLLSCHAHNEEDRIPVVLERLAAGEPVALITDAGAPAISDPGGRMVEAVIAAGFRVEVFPGPSAPVAALMGAGFDVSRYAFLGFVPRKGGRRRELVESAAHTGLALVLFEAPGRVDETLKDLAEWLGPRRVVVGRELTKLHETFHRGVLGEALEPPLVEKGEAVIVVEGGAPVAAPDVEAEVATVLADAAGHPKERAKKLAKLLGIPVREAYARVTTGTVGVALKRPDLGDVSRHLAGAARALVGLVGGEPGELSGPTSEIDGADELLELIARKPLPIAAPVEATELARALLSALSAADALGDALVMFEENEGRRVSRGGEGLGRAGDGPEGRGGGRGGAPPRSSRR